jgi:A/G-specific adenine glycosylase
LLRWYDAARRDLPWRDLSWRDRQHEPRHSFYRIWLSEIMLQQTRVEAVIPYYHLFLERFPSVEALAAAPTDAVLAAWSGLGYYSRARNLHRAAKQLAAGKLPAGYEEILALPGIGPYTAAAVASIALELPHAAVDGNVIRVVARLTNDASEITAPATRRRFTEEAAGLLDRRRPGDFNQAMMELGATVCLPRKPLCDECPVAPFCAARAAGTERGLPVKLKAARAREVAIDLAIVERAGRILLVRRGEGEKRLADFWELPTKEMFSHPDGEKLAEFRHQIVNDRFRVTVWHFPIGDDATLDLAASNWAAREELDRLPVTTVTRKALAFRTPPATSARRKG